MLHLSKLKKVREDKGLTQKLLAEVSGVSLRSIQKYESGERDITKAEVATVIKLADALEVNVKEIVYEVR